MEVSQTEIEDAVIERLKGIRGSLGLRVLDSYGGELNGDSMAAEALVFPAVYVSIDGMEHVTGNRADVETYTIRIYAADRNTRGDASQRRGDSHSPGVYAMLMQIRQALKRHVITVRDGMRINAMNLKRERIVAHSGAMGICVAQADYELMFAV